MRVMGYMTNTHWFIKNLTAHGVKGSREENRVLRSLKTKIMVWSAKHIQDWRRHPHFDEDDLAQETLIRVWKKAHTYKGKNDHHAAGWIWSIIKNAYWDLAGTDSKKGRAELDARKTMKPFDGQECFRLPRYGERGQREKRAIRDAERNKKKRDDDKDDSPEDEAA